MEIKLAFNAYQTATALILLPQCALLEHATDVKLTMTALISLLFHHVYLEHVYDVKIIMTALTPQSPFVS